MSRPGQPRGGTKFQKMMALILGYPFSPSNTQGQAFHDTHIGKGKAYKKKRSTVQRYFMTEPWDDNGIFTWDAETHTYGQMFLQPKTGGKMGDEWFEGYMGNSVPIPRYPKDKDMKDKGKKGQTPAPAHLPATARPVFDYLHYKINTDFDKSKKSMKIGLPMGNYNNVTNQCYSNNKEMETLPSVGIYGKLDSRASLIRPKIHQDSRAQSRCRALQSPACNDPFLGWPVPCNLFLDGSLR